MAFKSSLIVGQLSEQIPGFCANALYHNYECLIVSCKSFVLALDYNKINLQNMFVQMVSESR
jgi:hypothetical protein